MKKFFTLTELIISIVVIAILAAIIMLNMTDWKSKAQTTALEANEKQIQTAVDRYHLDTGLYPTNPQPTKGNPQLVEMDKIVPKYLRTKPNQDYLVWVDEDGNITIERGKGEEEKPPASTTLTCDEAKAQGYTCIYTPSDMNDIRNNMEGKYILMNDIDLSSYSNWTPIGTSDNGFKGVLDGNGKKITNLTINQTTSEVDYGLFGVVHFGTFRNLNLENLNFSFSASDSATVGGLIGYVVSDTTVNPNNVKLVIQNVSVSGKMTSESDVITMNGLIGEILTENAAILIDNIRISINIDNELGSGNGLLDTLYVENGQDSDPLDTTISNITISNIQNNSSYAAGLMSLLSADNGNANFHVSNVNISGELTGSNSVVGFLHNYDHHDSTVNTIIENIQIDTILSALEDKDVSGFVHDFYWDASEDNLDIQNVSIKGKFTGNSGDPFSSIVEVNGFASDINSYESTMDINMKGITISANLLAGENSEVTGFLNNYNPYESTVHHNFEDIEVNGTIQGDTLGGFFNNYNPYGNELDISVNNIVVNSDFTGEEVAGFSNNHNPSENDLTSTFSNVSVTGSLKGDNVSAFFLLFTPETETKMINATYSNFTFTGNIEATTAASGYILNFHDEYIEYRTFKSGGTNYTFADSSIGGTITVLDGSSGTFGGLIGHYYEELADNTYKFENIEINSVVSIDNEDPSTFKKGIVADSTYGGEENLTFVNVTTDSVKTGLTN